MFIAKLIFLPNKCFQTVVSHMFRVWWILQSVWEGLIDTWKVVLFYMFLGSSITSFSAKTDILTKLKLFSISEITETHWYTGNWGKFGVLGPLYRRPSVWDIAGVEEVELVEVLQLVFGTLGPLWNQSKFLIKNSGHINLLLYSGHSVMKKRIIKSFTVLLYH